MSKYDYLFMFPAERRKVLGEDDETLHLVNEHTLFGEELSLKQEVVKESILSLVGETTNEANSNYERLEILMESVLNKEIHDIGIAHQITNLAEFDIDILDKVYESIGDIYVTRSYKDKYINGLGSSKVNDSISVCSMIDKVYDHLKHEGWDGVNTENRLKNLLDLLKEVPSNMVSLHLCELSLVRLKRILDQYKDKSGVKDLMAFSLLKNNFISNDTAYSLAPNINSFEADSLFGKYQQLLKKENENELNIIMMDHQYDDIPGGYSNGKYTIVETAVSNMKGSKLVPEKLNKLIGKGSTLSYDVDDITVFKYASTRPNKKLFYLYPEEGFKVTVAFDNHSIDILLKDTDSDDVCYIPLVKNFCTTNNIEYLYGDNAITHMDCFIRRIKYKKNNSIIFENLSVLTEGLKFTEDGGVRLLYKPKGSYMDDYARINKIIVQNARNNNLEGVKTDLVFLFSFINETEKIVKGKVKVKDSVKEDAKKARMFATGDFKQYLAFAQERDPAFDFTKYFEENYKDEGKVLVEFSNSDIKGMKMLLRTLLGY